MSPRPARPFLVSLVLAAGTAACGGVPEEPAQVVWPTPKFGLVVSEHPLATRAGTEILEEGGNAADAAVATALVLAVCLPQAGNLGGGGLAIWAPHDPREEPLAFDFLETAPAGLAGATDGGGDLAGALAAGVPGTPAGLWELHQRCGRLPFEEVVRPAIRLAREGIRVDARLAADLRAAGPRARLEAHGRSRKVFYPRGEPLAEGRRWRQERLARTLELYARQGPYAFYGGELADALVAEARRVGGVLATEDLSAYEVRVGAPLRGWFRGLEILTVRPPSAGGLILLQVLAVLDGFPLDEERRTTLASLVLERGDESEEARPDGVGLSNRAVHWWIEAMRRAFADGVRHVADPAFRQVPVQELLSPEWIAQRRVSIGELATPAVEPMPAAVPGPGETTHLCVLDEDGNAVSLTTSLGGTFGCGVWVPEGGFLLNGAMAELSPAVHGVEADLPGVAQPLVAGRRPWSSMTPTVVRDGGQAVRLVIGGSGGTRIVTALLQVLLRTEVYGQSLADAVAAPRLHQQSSPPTTIFEPGWDPLLLQGLVNRGHRIERSEARLARIEAIQVEGVVPAAAGDARAGPR